MSRPKILLIDDIPSNLDVLIGILEKHYDLRIALSGQDGLVLLKQEIPDLILLDVMMPEMSGHEFLAKIQEIPAYQGIPVIFVTADTSQQSQLMGLGLGAEDYISKPIVPNLLRVRVKNILNRHAMEKALRDSEQHFSALATTAPVAILEMNESLEATYANPLWLTLSGTDTLATHSTQWQQSLHPSDSIQVIEKLNHALRTRERFQGEFRILSLERLTWVFGQGTVLSDKGLILVLTDITELKLAEDALALRESQLQTLLSSMEDMVFSLDTTGTIQMFNCPKEKLNHQKIPHSQWVGQTYTDVFPPPFVAVVNEALPELITKNHSIKKEFSLEEEGEKQHYHVIFSLLHDTNGFPSGFLCVAREMTEQYEMAKELKRLATTDPLTGAPNRRHFFQQATAELSRFQRFNMPCSLLMLDIDLFKRINDTYGHPVGDQVLEHLTQLVNKHIRPSDLFGRLGGEEFGLLLGGTEEEGAAIFAERLRSSIEQTPLPLKSEMLYFTASIGVTAFVKNDHSIESIISRADDALYQAKHQGRNCVVVR